MRKWILAMTLVVGLSVSTPAMAQETPRFPRLEPGDTLVVEETGSFIPESILVDLVNRAQDADSLRRVARAQDRELLRARDVISALEVRVQVEADWADRMETRAYEAIDQIDQGPDLLGTATKVLAGWGACEIAR